MDMLGIQDELLKRGHHTLDDLYREECTDMRAVLDDIFKRKFDVTKQIAYLHGMGANINYLKVAVTPSIIADIVKIIRRHGDEIVSDGQQFSDNARVSHAAVSALAVALEKLNGPPERDTVMGIREAYDLEHRSIVKALLGPIREKCDGLYNEHRLRRNPGMVY
jgi:hypothetical protein